MLQLVFAFWGCGPRELSESQREGFHTISNLLGRGVLVGMVAQAVPARDEDHGCGRDLRYQACTRSNQSNSLRAK